VADALLMTVDQLVGAVNGTCLCNYSGINGFSSVATDSRKVLPGSLFVPLMGEFQDGHTYIPKALELGASVIFVDAAHGEGSASLLYSLGKQYSASVIMVPNTLLALQDAARAYLAGFPHLRKIGITGSSGKTTTKEIVGSIFAQRYRVVMNEGNLNSETGLPLSVFRVRKEHEIGVFELGMNRRGEIAEIARVLSPSLALITNVGTAHIGILGSQAAIAEEKKSVFAFFSNDCAGFVPEDDAWREYLCAVERGTVHTFGRRSTEGFAGSEDLGIDGTMIRYEGEEIQFRLPGKYNLTNALGAIALARHSGLTPKEIKAGIESVKPLFGRAEVFRGRMTVMLDCYNANPDSMENALDFCGSLDWKGKKIYVLGSMLELGAESGAAHRAVCAQAARSGADCVFLYGDEMTQAGMTVDWGNTDVRFFSNIEDLSRAINERVSPGDFVFIKGSRGMALERVCPALDPKEGPGEIHG
jgi:UDP-N-acetylmuramoyl-tripeptide--D-alanyl-D-alanine ligase